LYNKLTNRNLVSAWFRSILLTWFDLLGSLDYSLMYYAVCTWCNRSYPNFPFPRNIIMTKQWNSQPSTVR